MGKESKVARVISNRNGLTEVTRGRRHRGERTHLFPRNGSSGPVASRLGLVGVFPCRSVIQNRQSGAYMSLQMIESTGREEQNSKYQLIHCKNKVMVVPWWSFPLFQPIRLSHGDYCHDEPESSLCPIIEPILS